MFKYWGFALVVTMVAASYDAQARPAQGTQNICISATKHQERASNIPTHLLGAISVVETGRWDEASKASFAWPWTVTAEGRGRYFPTKAGAIKEVLRLKRRGIKNIDVGCMQINLKYHPKAFANLNEAFDPKTNVAYAANFLKRLHKNSGIWTSAASQYHSNTPKYAQRYRKKVVKHWNELRAGRYASSPVQLAKFDTAKYGQRKLTMKNNRSATKEISRLVRSVRPNSAATTTPRYVAERAKGKAYATSWRQEKLAAYAAKKATR